MRDNDEHPLGYRTLRKSLFAIVTNEAERTTVGELLDAWQQQQQSSLDELPVWRKRQLGKQPSAPTGLQPDLLDDAARLRQHQLVFEAPSLRRRITGASSAILCESSSVMAGRAPRSETMIGSPF
jgi:hypothetical protein